MSESNKETLIWIIAGIIFIFFIFVIPLTVAEANKQACIELGLKSGYNASDIVSICGRR